MEWTNAGVTDERVCWPRERATLQLYMFERTNPVEMFQTLIHNLTAVLVG